jgi:hypothetical protein
MVTFGMAALMPGTSPRGKRAGVAPAMM